MGKQTDLYNMIETYAERHQLTNTKIALPLAKSILERDLRQVFSSENSEKTLFEHCMHSTKMLIDLHLILSTDELDLTLASMLCHDVLHKMNFAQGSYELVHTHHLDSRVIEIVTLVNKPAAIREEDIQAYYDGIKMDKLAVLVALAHRCILVEELSNLSITEVNNFIYEMRKYCLPMCVYAKQHYRNSQMSINIMMEKIRCLLDVADIISSRYQKRELAYTTEILSLMEENARLRGMIRQLAIGEIY